MTLASLPAALLLISAPAVPFDPLSYDPAALIADAPSLAADQSVGAAPAPAPCPVHNPTPAAQPATPTEPAAPAPAEPGQGTIVVTARPDSMPGDPLAGINAQSFEVVQEVDEQLVGPVAMAYKEAVPKPVRHGLRNFLRNLTEPIVALNFLLQLKPGKAFETLGRFALNSTIGVGGLFDVAKREPFNLPYRRNGFANTLGYYGVEPGAYLFLPLIGPTTVRDLVGGTIDALVLPTAVGSPFNRAAYTLPAATLSALQGRIQIDEQLNALRTQSNDPYIAARDFYLRRRQAEIDALRGRVPYPDSDFPFIVPTAGDTSAAPASAPALPYADPDPANCPQMPATPQG